MDNIAALPNAGRLWRSRADFFKPFQSAPSSSSEPPPGVISPLYDPGVAPLKHDGADEPDLKELNTALAALVELFPNIQPEVFRDMLLSLSGESRLQVVTEHLLKSKAKWVRGRWMVPKKVDLINERKALDDMAGRVEGDALPVEESFRSDPYKKAVKAVCYAEFNTLSHSTVKGVLAETNCAYARARPVLQGLAAKSWRFSLASIWARKRSPETAADHPNIVWQPDGFDRSGNAAAVVPAVKRTGSPELDHELYALFVEPAVKLQAEAWLAVDRALAEKVNEAEAEEAEALFDCECCCTSSPWESISTCNAGGHYACFRCIRFTVEEALYGQGWARSVDAARTTLRCLAPSAEDCRGCLPAALVRRAIAAEAPREEGWHELQQRCASEALLNSRLPLLTCPFCNYAEVDEPPPLHFKSATQIFSHASRRCATSPVLQMAMLTLLIASVLCPLPLLILLSFLYLLPRLSPTARSQLSASRSRLSRRRRGLRFTCRGPCAQSSCTRCRTPWRDPHVCFAAQRTSLRTAREASATAAVKRTCPACRLSFVKSSGCNRLVCNCGYAMCYICRAHIGHEGYAHFCQHFRPVGGRCGECERCDLYGDEDEEGKIREAVGRAEREWRDREGGGGESSAAAVEALAGEKSEGGTWWERGLDALVAAVVAWG